MRALCLSLLLAAPLPALAHPLVEQARAHYERANLEQALATLDRAAAADDLGRADLVALLELRVLVRLALGDEAAARADVARIAALDPEHQFGREFPPAISETLADARAAGAPLPSIDVAVETSAGAITLRPEVEDRVGLVRDARVHARPGPGGAWTSATGEPLVMGVAGGVIVEYYAEARGPGGVVLASVGTADAPLSSATVLGGETGEEDGRRRRPWLWVGIAAAATALIIIGLTVALAGGGGGQSDRFRPTRPMVEF